MAQLARTSFRERMERLEDESLSPLATRSYPAVRAEPEADSDHRTPFQRDRDRIVHTKAFRRLKHKTQVFIAPEGDHYRTRLTHTLEAAGIARTVARALGLNEDLTEAIALGHELGHPPFGHIGEEVLDACLRERFGVGFRHNHHSLRAGVLAPEDLPEDEIAALGATGSARIDTLVRDMVERSVAAGDIVQGPDAGAAMDRLRTFMFERVYLGPESRSEAARIERMLGVLFAYYADNPPPALVEGAEEAQRIVDWLAGMTDRFALRTFA